MTGVAGYRPAVEGYEMNRLNIVTLGVKDMGVALKFYRELGFEAYEEDQNPAIVFFNNRGSKLALYPLGRLAEDISEDNPPRGEGFSGITLAYVAESMEEVDALLKKAEKAGGTIVKTPRRVFWGGYSGYFRDPDGYYWEVAYSEDWVFDENGMVIIEA